MEIKFDIESPKFTVVSSQKEMDELFEKAQSTDLLAIDVEATGLDPFTSRLLLIQIGIDDHAYIINMNGSPDLSKIKPILEGPRPLKVLQNASFDYKFIKHHTGIVLGNIFDTMIAERLLTVGRTRQIGLAAIARKYLNIDLDKSIRKSFENSSGHMTDEQLKYAALDVIVLPYICREQITLLKKERLTEVAHLEFQVVPVVAEMELKGILLDMEKWKLIFADITQKRDVVHDKIQEFLTPYYKQSQESLFGGSPQVVNLNSPLQVIEAFRKIGIDLPSTGVEILKKTNHDLARLLLDYRQHEKLISSFGQAMLDKINPITHRIHPNFIQIGADTGRFSCNNPNLQQIPSDSTFRDCFIAPPGYDLVVSDYSQQELRVLASLTNDPLFIKAYQEDMDLHSLTASEMFGVPLKDFTQEKVPEELKKMRKSAKVINFGIAYGMGPNALATLLGVTSDEAKVYLEKYAKTYKGVNKWLYEAGKTAVAKGYSLTILGRKRWYEIPGKDDPEYRKKIGDIERQGKNTPIQGSSADMTKRALIYIMRRIKEEQLDASLLLAVHDEVVVEAREDVSAHVRDLVEQEMVRAGTEMLDTVPIKAEAVVTKVWQH